MGNIYETQKLIDEYLLFHYGQTEEIMPWPWGPHTALHFPERSVSSMIGHAPHARALDVGCAVGRSCFALSVFCHEVIGIDFSHGFIAAAEELRTSGRLSYQCREEGPHERTLVALRPTEAHPDRIRFVQGDAMSLPEDLGDFDLVHAANLLCRLPEPARFLNRLPSLVRLGGSVILTTPCTWLEEFTPSEHWPRGTTLAWLQEFLSPHFELVLEKDLPFVIREHARKFQWSVALATRWIRRLQ